MADSNATIRVLQASMKAGPRRGAHLVFVIALLGCGADARAQQLAIRNYDVADGLPHNDVQSIYQDAKGFVWLGTFEGLSRFDGHRFTNYDRRHGLPHQLINDIVEDPQGRLWVATNGGGVARLLDEPFAADVNGQDSPASLTRFVSYPIGKDLFTNGVNRLLFDGEGRLWCATDTGIYRSTSPDITAGAFERMVPGSQPSTGSPALRDHRGRLWFAVNDQVIEFSGGQLTRHPLPSTGEPRTSVASREVNAIIETPDGTVLAADALSVFEFVEPTRRWRKLAISIAPLQPITAINAAKDGELWIGTFHGLIHYRDGERVDYHVANGLSGNSITTLATDREGNLWIGTSRGVGKLTDEAIVGFTAAHGLPQADAYRLYQDRSGRIYATIGCAPSTLVEIGVRRGTVIADGLSWNSCRAPLLLQDTRNHWWVQTERKGMEYVVGPNRSFKNGLALAVSRGAERANVWGLYESRNGIIWIGAENGVYAASVESDATPRVDLVATPRGVELFAEARAGTLWLGTRSVIHRRMADRLSQQEITSGLPSTEARAFFIDSRGRLWIGLRYHGVSMTSEPDAVNPRFINYSTADGLRSDTVWAIAEDASGRIYLGTGRGLDRLDPKTQDVHHYTTEDGVLGLNVRDLLLDRSGFLWIASDGGISRLDPRVERPALPPPRIFITGLRLAGREVTHADVAIARPASFELQPTRASLDVQFVAPRYRSDATVRYQHRLEGADVDWSHVSDTREVSYAGLTPGRYRFMVRAVDANGGTSVSPAVLEFRVLPHFYQRWWFTAATVVFIGALTYALHRWRVAQLLELAHVRTRIATDLHDDIGGNLTKIAVLSEVVRQRLPSDGDASGLIGAIARISRESVGSLSDIVWAINPRRDTLLELTRRMRQHAEELFALSDVRLNFDAPIASHHHERIPAEVRRDVFLIFKEAVNNAARHSRCTRLDIRLDADAMSLTLRVADDGIGFEQKPEAEGEGLASMQRRADQLRATLSIHSDRSTGTTIEVRIPLRRSRRKTRLRRDVPPTNSPHVST